MSSKTNSNRSKSSDQADKFSQQADKFSQQAEEKAPGIFREFFDFLLYNKKWWLIPILMAIVLLVLLVGLGGTGLAPFIYPLF